MRVLTYYHAAGQIIGPKDEQNPTGELPASVATALAMTFAKAAAVADFAGHDRTARIYACWAVDLLKAIGAYDDHHCTATGIGRSRSPLAEFRRRVSAL